MKKLLSISMAIIMAATIFVVPSSFVAYGDVDNNSTTAAEQENVVASDIDLSKASVVLDQSEYAYTGNAIKPEPVVQYSGATLIKGTHYTVAYKNNIKAGTAEVIITGKEGSGCIGTIAQTFNIVPADISKAKVSLVYTYYNYRGEPRIPTLTVKYNSKTLKEGVDYKLNCENNKYPGTAKVKVIGINNFTGQSAEKNFYIANMSNFKVKSTGSTYIQLSWSREPGVTGYEIYKYSFSKKKWYAFKTVVGNENVTYTDKDEKAGYGNKYKIRAYVKDKDGKHHHGVWTDVLCATTKPGRVTLNSFTTNVKLDAKVTWKTRKSSGYQVLLSRNSDFSNATKYTIKSSSASSKTITGLRDNRTYYVKVRAYRTYYGKTQYGSWSYYKKIKTSDTGWITINGKKYYYRNGEPLHGSHTIDGSKYYFGSGAGRLLGTTPTMWSKVANETSGTSWLLITSRDENRTCVYHREDGRWILKYYWKCTTGAEGTRTPRGTFTVPETKTHLEKFGSGYTCWYATRFYKRCYYHSVLYYQNSQVNILDGRLGASLSHGCIRLAKSNALWIYNNIDAGTKVIVY